MASIPAQARKSPLSRPYGRIPRKGHKPKGPAQPAEIRMVIPQTYTLEQFALEVQRGFHRLQELGATGLTRFRAQLMPLDEHGEPMTLHDEHGEPVTVINIPELPPEAPYRDNEPGVGVLPAAAPRNSPGGRSGAGQGAAPARTPGTGPARGR